MSVQTVIYPPFIEYRRMFQRPQQLLRHLARLGWRAVYHDPGRVGRRQPYEEIEPNLFLLSVNAGARSLPLDQPPVLWITYPLHWTLVGKYYGEQLVVFDICDAPAGPFADWAAGVGPMLERADLVFCASWPLYEAYRGRHPHVYLCPNGADYPHFARVPAELPLELLGLPRPIIGYHGALAPWLDWELIAGVAQARKDWSLVMVGPPYALPEDVLPRAPNLHYLGEKAYGLLPAYLHGFDAGIIPFTVDAMTAAADPIKLYEYLAAGLGVVSTPLPQAQCCPLVRTASGVDGFVAALADVLEDSGAETRRAWAESQSWAVRARLIDAALQAFLDPGPHPVPAGGSGPMHRALAQWLKSRVPAASYLGVGAGTGPTSLCLAASARRVAYVDREGRAVAGMPAGPGVEVYRADILSLPFADGEFEVVWNAGVLEHYDEELQVKALREWSRVAACAVVGVVPRADGRPYPLVGEPGCPPAGPKRCYTTFRPQFEQAGLVVVEEADLGAGEARRLLDPDPPRCRRPVPAGRLLVTVGRRP